MTVDIAALRKSHVTGWKPRQSVEIDVMTLEALLDEVADLRRRIARVESGESFCDACGRPGADETTSLCRACDEEIERAARGDEP